MRKLFLNPFIMLTLIASFLLVNSCDKDEEVVEADLIGTWDIGQASVDIQVGPLSLFDVLMTSVPGIGQEAAEALVDELTSEFLDIGGGTITFNEDYSYIMIQSELEESGTWRLEGDKLFLTVNGENMDDDPLIIKSLNSSAAIIAWEEEQEIALEGMPSINAIIIFELNLSKQ